MFTQKQHSIDALISACRKGDTKAQFRLYQLYAKPMLNSCYRIMNHREEAEDVLQEAFLKAFMNLPRFRGDSSFGTWLKRIVINQAINAMKKKKMFFLQLEEVEDPIDDSANMSEFPENIQQAYDAIHRLPTGYRTVFSLYALEGYDHEEIGEILGISSSTSVSQYSRAKRKLREIIQQTSPYGQARKMV